MGRGPRVKAGKPVKDRAQSATQPLSIRLGTLRSMPSACPLRSALGINRILLPSVWYVCSLSVAATNSRLPRKLCLDTLHTFSFHSEQLRASTQCYLLLRKPKPNPASICQAPPPVQTAPSTEPRMSYVHPFRNYLLSTQPGEEKGEGNWKR